MTATAATATATVRGAEAIVSDFLGGWRKRDIDYLTSFFTADAVYHNVPVAPIEGVDGIRAIFANFLEVFEDASLDVVNIAAKGDVVLAERIDRFLMKDGRRIELQVTGVFVLRDGKIARFSDYFDLEDFKRQSGLNL